MNKKNSLLASLVLCLSVNAAAQEPNRCAELMKFGIHDEYTTISRQESFALFQFWVCRSQFSTHEQAKTEAARLGIGIDAFSLNFDGNTAERNWAQWSDRMCLANFNVVSSNSAFINQVRMISPPLMNVVKACMEGSQPGFRAWIETSRDRTQVTFRTRYVPDGEAKAIVRSFSVTPRNVLNACQPRGTLARGVEYGAEGKSLTCEVDPNRALTFTLNTSQGNVAPRLDRYEPYSPPPPPTATLSADPTSIVRGASTILSWTTTNALTAEITPNVRAVAPIAGGTKSVSPDTTTQYTLVATGVGNPALASVTVKVEDPCPTASLTVSAGAIAYGQSVTLNWEATNATQISIDQGVGNVAASGSRTLSPVVTTTYNLVANGSCAPASKSVTVQVNPKIRLWEHVGFGGRSFDVNGATELPDWLEEQPSSIEVFTDEWAYFYGNDGMPTRLEFLAVKGPRRLDNLHIINAHHFDHWGDKIKSVFGFNSTGQIEASGDRITIVPN